ncbi:MAG: MarR family transcriptional regulator [Chloroflexota bacterium]
MIPAASHHLFPLLARLAVVKAALAQNHRLSLRELLTLGVLASRGHLSFKELYQSLSIPKSALTAIIDKLQKQGLVERHQDKEDRRRWIALLTPQGEVLTQSIWDEEVRLLEPLLREVPEPSLRDFASSNVVNEPEPTKVSSTEVSSTDNWRDRPCFEI